MDLINQIPMTLDLTGTESGKMCHRRTNRLEGDNLDLA